MLFACTRQNASTGETETNTATKAALGGAIAGALAGTATGKKNGAVFGALGGENELQLIMSQGIGFKSAEYNLTGSIFSSLDGVAKVLNEYRKSSLVVSGHTDSIGAAEGNMTLSERRAGVIFV